MLTQGGEDATWPLKSDDQLFIQHNEICCFMLELRGVSKIYRGETVLHPLDLTVEAAENLVLIGPSGCGKSTTLRLMMGLIRTDSGEVSFDGTKLTPQNVLELRQRMGYVIQDGGLFPHLTAAQNVTLMARHLKWDEKRISTRLEELRGLTHLPKESLSRYPAQISGGQRQRVGLMRALMLDPDVLFLDEPLGALDPLIRADLQTELREIFNTLHKTVVLVTHDLAEAAYFADTVVLMRSGRVVQRGTVSELWDKPAEPFVEEFVQAQRSIHADRETP